MTSVARRCIPTVGWSLLAYPQTDLRPPRRFAAPALFLAFFAGLIVRLMPMSGTPRLGDGPAPAAGVCCVRRAPTLRSPTGCTPSRRSRGRPGRPPDEAGSFGNPGAVVGADLGVDERFELDGGERIEPQSAVAVLAMVVRQSLVGPLLLVWRHEEREPSLSARAA